MIESSENLTRSRFFLLGPGERREQSVAFPLSEGVRGQTGAVKAGRGRTECLALTGSAARARKLARGSHTRLEC